MKATERIATDVGVFAVAAAALAAPPAVSGNHRFVKDVGSRAL